MPPKNDPYATKSARAADFVLILIAILAILFAVLTSSGHHGSDDSSTTRRPSANLATR